MIDQLWPPDILTQLANKYGSDKGSRALGAHCYAGIYHRFFHSMRYDPISLLEIGLQHTLDHRSGVVPSLQMWREYFSCARLVGFDIRCFADVMLPKCCILQGDMSSRDDLHKLAPYGPFDIIIDDASHISCDQQIALAALFRLIKPGGIYVIEDLHWQPPNTEMPSVPKTRTLLRQGQFTSAVITSEEASFLAANVCRIELFDSRDRYNSDRSDAIAFIFKT
jgi:hypothetical protein